MVTPLKHLSILAAGCLVLALPAPVSAQAEAPRFTVAATGGVSAGDRTGATYGGEVTIRLSRLFDVTIGATRLSDITPDEFTDGAEMIAGLVDATADAHASANVIETGVRLRVPTTSPMRPYAVAGGGIARLTAKTTFFRGGQAVAPDKLGISLGPDLNGQVTKGLAFVGAGLDVSAGNHVVIDAGARYSAIVAETDGTPRFYLFPVLRFQVGVGVRF